MKRSMSTVLCSLLCGCLLAGCQREEPAGQYREIKILTYNIFHGEKFYDRGESNLEEIAKVINEHQPDVVALQEVDSMTTRSARLHHGVRKDLMQELARMTGMHGYFGQAMVQHDGGYGEGILSRSPAVPTVHILPTPKGGEPRALISIEHAFADGRRFVFSGTHLCHEFEDNRVAQAQAIAEILTSTRIPVIVAGDFNFTPEQRPYATIRQYMLDAGEIAGTTSNTWPYHEPGARLDYIFMDAQNPWRVKEVRLIQNDASDHFPVLAVLELM